MTDFWLKHPDQCSASVLRGPRHAKEEDACGKPAVAVALYQGEEYEWHAYPVCKHHSRGRPMMPLAQVVSEVRLALPADAGHP